MKLKLNKRRTFLIGFAFFAILMLWRIYYHYVPLYLDDLLTYRFGAGNYEDVIGLIMSLDSLAAILIIPLFGFFSDRTKGRLGKRVPYIVFGSLASLIIFPLVSVMWLSNAFVWYFVVVALLVLSMASFRGPAIALMPDLTPKPLRSSANAIINFVGYLGAIAGTGLTMFFSVDNGLSIIPFIATSVVLICVILIFLLKFSERKATNYVKKDMLEGEKYCELIEKAQEGKKVSRRDKWNFAIICGAVFACWFAFNALEGFGSLYARRYLDGDSNWGTLATVLGISSLLTFLPSIWLAKKIGRKSSVLIGLGLIIGSLLIAALTTNGFSFWLILLFAINGAGWALVMVHSFPMFVEIAPAKYLGRMTGIYYFVSMGAMFLTSIIAGQVFRHFGLQEWYFWYAIIFMSVAFILCIFYKTNRKVADKKPVQEEITSPELSAPQEPLLETHKTEQPESHSPAALS